MKYIERKKYSKLKRNLFKLKVTFHFQTKLTDEENTVIDDSREWKKPMQLILGRKFKLSVWEVLIQAMSLNEVSKFIVHKSVSFCF